MQIKINELTLAKVIELSQFIKEECKGTLTLEETAQDLMRIFYQTFITDSGNSAIVLTRFFKSCFYCDLPDDIQGDIKQKEGRAIIPPQDKYLTLLGTWGDLEEWRQREKSENHKAFSLNDSDVLYKLPMLSAVFSQIGFKIPTAIESDKSIIVDKQDIDYGLFYIDDAKDSKFIPKQAEFVEPFGVKSTFGFGGHYVSTDVYAIITFFRENVNRRIAKLFLSLNPAIKLLTLRHDSTKNVFMTDSNDSISSYLLAEIQKMPDSQKFEHFLRSEETRAIADELKRSNEALLEMANILKGKNVELMSEMAERKQVEEELRELNDTLEKCVDERTKELSKTNISLRREVVERHLIEIARQESEEKCRAIFEQAVDSIVVINSDTGEIVDFNTHAHENLGYTREEFKNIRIAEIEAIESQEDVMNHIKRIKSKGFDIFETKHKTKKCKIRHVLVSAKILAIPGKNLISNFWHDITERKKSEELLKEQKKSLEQKNIALHEVLGSIEIEKKQIKDNIIANAENLIMPLIQKLRLRGESLKYVKLLQKTVQELTSSFGTKLTEKSAGLTSREIEVCNMIKNDLTSKEIARLLNINLRTTEKHRANIRNKLGIINKNINLTSYLKTL